MTDQNNGFLEYEYFINLDERGEFFADVRNDAGVTVYEIHGSSIFEDGFMSHCRDVDGLAVYLRELGIMPDIAHLTIAN